MRFTALFLFVCCCTFPARSQFGGVQKDRQLSAVVKQQLMDSIINHVVTGYVFEDSARHIGKSLKAFRKGNVFNEINTYRAFTDALNLQFRQISQDKHLALLYSFDTIPVARQDEVSFPAFIKEFAVNNNYGFNKLDILPGNVGYMNILGFFPFDEARDIAIAAFGFIENTSALIIDLRQNNGGESNIGNFVLSYFFGNEPVNILTTRFRKANRIEQSWSSYYVPGKRYVGKPVYVLTGPQTFSAGEAMAFILQSHHKAVVVGEQTGGGANMCDLVRLHPHIMINLPVASPTGGDSHTNWEGTGVAPDIMATSDKAIEVAHVAALKALKK